MAAGARVPANSDWQSAYAREVDALFRQRLRIASSLFLILHVVAFAIVRDGGSSELAKTVRILIIPLSLLLIGSTWFSGSGRLTRALSGVFIASIAAYSAWNGVLAGNPLETRALMLTMLGAGLLFPFGTRAMLALSIWVLGLYLFAAQAVPDLAAIGSGGFFVFGAGALATVAALLSSRLREREFHARRELERANAETDALLRNMLPAPIAERLKKQDGFIADRHDEVTVMFADIAGFTSMSSTVSPDKLVAFLNALFSRLDALALKHGLEKIKTIGDAYMVVGGLPEPRSDHAVAVADMALEMRESLAGLPSPDGQPLAFRVGIHTGPVVAGVIGATKLSYDLWGDTVNTASRMESHGEPNTIQVSAATEAHLSDGFLLAPRGSIEVKGKGAMDVFVLLERRKLALDPGP